MSRKARRGRSNKGGAIAASQVVNEEPLGPASQPAEGLGGGLPAEASPAYPAVECDDSSYPPVDLDTHFFDAEGHLRQSEPPVEAEERDPRMALKRTPMMTRRRADLQKYVKLALAAASALCLAALVKLAVTRNASDEGARGVGERVAAAQQPAPITVATPPAESPVAPAPAEPDPPAATTATAGPDPEAAAKEKNDCRAALERGKVADAIEAGERSVALDPTDSEAWLILGAAYQQKGDMKNARRSYRACLEQGKRGSKSECAAMPH